MPIGAKNMSGTLSRTAMVILIAVGVIARVWYSTLGSNYDLESYRIVADLMADGKIVWANTSRYNYGPIWAYIVWGIQSLAHWAGFFDAMTLHVLIASVLTAVDVLIMFTLMQALGQIPGLVFFLSPVSILITGFYTQFDNLPILFGLWSWLVIKDDAKRRDKRRVIWSAGLLGLSLSIKHTLIFFPLWILVWTGFGSIRKRSIYCLVSYGVFLGGFVPFSFDPAVLAGIKKNVFEYSSIYGNGLINRLVEVIVPVKGVESLLAFVPFVSGFKVVWVAVMLLVGRVMMKALPGQAIYLYLIAMFALSPSVADQYLAIPIVACAVFGMGWPLLVANVLSVAVLLGSPNGLFIHSVAMMGEKSGLSYHHIQFWYLVFLCLVAVRRLNVAQPATNQKELRASVEQTVNKPGQLAID